MPTADQTRVAALLATADRDFDVALLLLQNAPQFYESIGFHCQQAVEKYVKAVLVVHQLPVAHTHDLRRLTTELAPFISFTS